MFGLFKSKETKQQEMTALIRESFRDIIEERQEDIFEVVREFLLGEELRRAQIELEDKHKREQEEIARIKKQMDSNSPWIEAIDLRGNMTSPKNYRWNQAFIDRRIIENSLYNMSDADIVNDYLEEKELNRRKAIIEEERKKHEDSLEPWFEWVINGHQTDNGYPVHMEWNSAFLNHIKSLGFVGRNEEEIVRLWLSQMIRHTPRDSGDVA